MIKILFFPNGNTAAFQDGKQVPLLQESWLLLYVHMVAALGIDPADLDITMPDGRKAKIVEYGGVLTWEMA